MKAKSECKFALATQFTRFPGGRLRAHGPYSGEQFREEVLLPLMRRCQHVVIDLTGTIGYGASFLDESFGELGKVMGLKEIRERLALVADDDPTLIDIVWEKIKKGAEEG